MADADNKVSKILSQQRARKSRQVDDFLRETLALREGREFFYWLLALCKVGHNPFSNNALTTSFACGELNVGQQVTSRIMDVAPEHYLNMLREQKEEQDNVTRTIAAARSADSTGGWDSASGGDAESG